MSNFIEGPYPATAARVVADCVELRIVAGGRGRVGVAAERAKNQFWEKICRSTLTFDKLPVSEDMVDGMFRKFDECLDEKLGYIILR